MQNNITVIIPIFNEEKNIGLLIDKIYKNFKNINILVVDDFSVDNSYLVVKENIKKYGKNITLLKKSSKIDGKGLTYSIIKGISSVKTRYFIVMDGDFQHPVNSLKNFVELFKNGKDIVIGQRKKIVFDEKKYRIFISKIGNFLINIKILKNGFWLKDPLSGFFGGKTLFFKEKIFKNKSIFIGSGYKFLFEFLKIIKNKDTSLGTFYFSFGKRKFGKSKISSKIHLYCIKGLIR